MASSPKPLGNLDQELVPFHDIRLAETAPMIGKLRGWAYGEAIPILGRVTCGNAGSR